jgi:hypothetical protein
MGNDDRVVTVTVTENEAAWLEFLRLLCYDDVPGPTLLAIQALRLGLAGRCPSEAETP